MMGAAVTIDPHALAALVVLIAVVGIVAIVGWQEARMEGRVAKAWRARCLRAEWTLRNFGLSPDSGAGTLRGCRDALDRARPATVSVRQVLEALLEQEKR